VQALGDRPDPDAPSRTFEFRLWLVAVLVGGVALHAVTKKCAERSCHCRGVALKSAERMRLGIETPKSPILDRRAV